MSFARRFAAVVVVCFSFFSSANAAPFTLHLTGNASATDPACGLSPHHAMMHEAAVQEAAAPAPDFIYRRMRGVTPV